MSKTKRWQSVRKRQATSSPLSKVHTQITSKSKKLYTDCKRLPLDIFIECLLDNDFSRLVIEGEPTKAEIGEAWMKIFNEYSIHAGGDSHNEIFIKTKAINALSAKIFIIEGLCCNLRHDHYEPACKILNGYALHCDLKADDSYKVRAEKVEMILSRAGRFYTQLDKLKVQLLEAQKKNVKGAGGSDYFDDMLNLMSEQNGYMVRAQDITVTRFIKMINKLRDIQKQQQLKTMKHGSGKNR
jgi:hypothetical protein